MPAKSSSDITPNNRVLPSRPLHQYQPKDSVLPDAPLRNDSKGAVVQAQGTAYRVTIAQASLPALEKLLRVGASRLLAGHLIEEVTYRQHEEKTGGVYHDVSFTHVVEGHLSAEDVRRTWVALAARCRPPIRCVVHTPVEIKPKVEVVDPELEAVLAEMGDEVFDDAASVDGEKLKKLGKLVDQYVKTEQEMLALLTQVEDRSKELTELRMVKLPELMKQARITEQVMDSGHKVTLKTNVEGGWPKALDQRAKAEVALKRLEAFDLLKQTVVTSFSPEEQATADRVVAYLKRNKLVVDVDRGIHWQTYRSWGKEMMANDQLRPTFLELINDLGLVLIDQATVKMVKSKKVKGRKDGESSS